MDNSAFMKFVFQIKQPLYPTHISPVTLISHWAVSRCFNRKWSQWSNKTICLAIFSVRSHNLIIACRVVSLIILRHMPELTCWKVSRKLYFTNTVLVLQLGQIWIIAEHNSVFAASRTCSFLGKWVAWMSNGSYASLFAVMTHHASQIGIQYVDTWTMLRWTWLQGFASIRPQGVWVRPDTSTGVRSGGGESAFDKKFKHSATECLEWRDNKNQTKETVWWSQM